MGADPILLLIETGLGPIYGRSWVAPLVILPAMLLTAIGIWVYAREKSQPYLRASKARIQVLRKALGGEGDPIADRVAFGAKFAEIERVMLAAPVGAQALVEAWRSLSTQILDESTSPIRCAVRPDVFFRRAGPKQALLIFWSNIFVGVGLVLTFLGLIYALAVAADGMHASGGNVAEAQGSLIALLTAAAAKFFTSVGGLLASLGLRFAEYGLSRAVTARTDDLCGLLDRGLLYVSPQRLAAEQLDELKAQSKELKSFNTDLALQIGEQMGTRFAAAMAPVHESLTSLNAGMANMSEGLREGLRGGAAEAVSAAASGELRALGQTLNSLRVQLETLGGHVGASGEDAARQIRTAGADFREAAENIRAAFDKLAGNVEGRGARMTEQGEAAARVKGEALDRVLSGLNEAHGRSAAALDDLGTRLRAQGDATSQAQFEALGRMLEVIEAAQGRSAGAVAGAAAALEGAGRQAANDLQTGLTAALRDSVAESQGVFRSAVSEAGEGLRGASYDLSKAVTDAASRVLEAGTLFQRSGDGAGRAATAMTEVATGARETSTALTDAARGFAMAATPVSQTTEALTLAADRIAKALEATRQANEDALKNILELSKAMRESSDAAEDAWEDYVERFDGVDTSLEKFVKQFSDTVGDTISQFRDFAQQVDKELGSAVSKLSGSLSTIEDYADALERYVEKIGLHSLELAE